MPVYVSPGDIEVSNYSSVGRSGAIRELVTVFMVMLLLM